MKEEQNNENRNNKTPAFKIFKPYIYMAFCIIILSIAVKGLVFFSVGETGKNRPIKKQKEKEENSLVEINLFEICNEQAIFNDFIEENTYNTQKSLDSSSNQENSSLNSNIES